MSQYLADIYRGQDNYNSSTHKQQLQLQDSDIINICIINRYIPYTFFSFKKKEIATQKPNNKTGGIRLRNGWPRGHQVAVIWLAEWRECGNHPMGNAPLCGACGTAPTTHQLHLGYRRVGEIAKLVRALGRYKSRSPAITFRCAAIHFSAVCNLHRHQRLVPLIPCICGVGA